MNLVPVVWVIQAMNLFLPTSHPYRYEPIAECIAEASNAHALFPGERGSFQTAGLLVALAWHESKFRTASVGDHGRSFGLFQIQPATAGVSSAVLLAPRSASIAVELLARSMAGAAQRPIAERLGLYASGRVDRGLRESRDIVGLASKVVGYDD